MLKIIINRAAKTASFFGDTFTIKDQIKALGRASWVAAEKTWRVEEFKLDKNEILELFPKADLEEIGDASTETSDLFNSPSSPTTKEIPTGLSVISLQNQIRSLIKREFSLPLFVFGVVNKINRGTGGTFIELRDTDHKDISISCVIWNNEAQLTQPLHALGFTLEPELQVMFKVQVDLNPKKASISLVITEIVPEYTLGKLAAERELTNERLKKEGIFSANKKLILPQLPISLGVITSAAGTVINDFMGALAQGEFGFKIFWLKTGVQGNAAKALLIKAIKHLSTLPELDAILIFRGGGSKAELSIFNNYELARTICLCRVPVLSAIGHQEDHSSVQDVSFLSFGVPRDIGTFFAAKVIEKRSSAVQIIRYILELSKTLHRQKNERLGINALSLGPVARRDLHGFGVNLERLQTALPALAKAQKRFATSEHRHQIKELAALAQTVIQKSRHSFSNKISSLIVLQTRFLSKMRMRLLEVKPQEGARQFLKRRTDSILLNQVLINQAAPEAQLKRGFVLVKDASELKFITRGRDLQAGDCLKLVFADKTNAVIVHDGD